MSENVKNINYPKLGIVEKISIIVSIGLILYLFVSCFSEIKNTNNSDTDYWVISKEIVKEQLKSPSSAKFPTYHDTFVTSNNGDIVVESYVEAENSFGVSLKKSFKVVFKDGDFDNYTVSIY